MSTKRTLRAGTGVLMTRLLPDPDDQGQQRYEYRVADARVHLDHRGVRSLPEDVDQTVDAAMAELIGTMFLAEGTSEPLYPPEVIQWTRDNAQALEAVETTLMTAWGLGAS